MNVSKYGWIVSVLVAGAFVSMPAAVFAQGKDESYRNGVPFADLAAEIEANSVSIATLETTTEVLRADLGVLAAEFVLLEGRVSINEGTIATVNGQISTINVALADSFNQIDLLHTDMEALAANVETNQTAIDALVASITALEAQITSQLVNLDAEVKKLAGEVSSIGRELDGFRAQVNAEKARVQAQIGDLLAEIDYIGSQVQSTLIEQVVANTRIRDLQTQIDKLNKDLSDAETDLTVLERKFAFHYHSYSDAYDKVVHTHISHYITIGGFCFSFGGFGGIFGGGGGGFSFCFPSFSIPVTYTETHYPSITRQTSIPIK